ncbi:MAG: OadG family protein [Lachnospiraceae bacterium]|jgi:sodium pump decarboxylase gamma subunit|nr:OadG family protein [Lachnospiraceae bacterium]MCR5345636.1 OadG family protein [Lachnospiraceae bacterium]
MIVDALLNMVIGMASVFMVLILISLLIASLNIVPYLQNKLNAKKKANVTENTASVPEASVSSYDVSNDTQLVAVITAAIMAYGNNASDSDFVVRSIKRR